MIEYAIVYEKGDTMDYLDREKERFLNRVSEFNSYIDRNPHVVELNMREIMDCYIDLATISASLVSEAVKYSSYKFIDDTYNKVMNCDGVFKSCYNRLREIIIKSKVNSSKGFTEFTFFDKNEVNDILDLFEKMIKMGCYPVPISGNIRDMKKKLICDVVAVAYEIWSRKQKDATYQYGDTAAYVDLKNLYKGYKESLDMSDCNRVGIVYDRNGCEIIDTDNSEKLLMNSIDNFMKYIDDNYRFREVYLMNKKHILFR